MHPTRGCAPDAVLGPIFEAKIHDWEEHLAKLTDFWSSIVHERAL